MAACAAAHGIYPRAALHRRIAQQMHICMAAASAFKSVVNAYSDKTWPNYPHESTYAFEVQLKSIPSKCVD